MGTARFYESLSARCPRKHNGKVWESLVANNVWEPGVTGTEALWKEVSE